jgi:uncharacterized protein YjbI with pentapeptide repeats
MDFKKDSFISVGCNLGPRSSTDENITDLRVCALWEEQLPFDQFKLVDDCSILIRALLIGALLIGALLIGALLVGALLTGIILVTVDGSGEEPD